MTPNLGNIHNGGARSAEKDSEFICNRCHARCTESPIDGTEYGHKGGCPRREIDRAVNGPSYNPEDDPLAQSDQQAVADGGDRRVD